jgi:hypothetical protein
VRRGEAMGAEPGERSALGGRGDGVKRRTECPRSEEGRGGGQIIRDSGIWGAVKVEGNRHD